MHAYIVTIGDELLIGKTVDSNSAWIARELNQIGIQVREILTVSDEADHIEAALDVAILQGDIVFVTGGLGPTKDDLTKYTLAKYFNTELVLNEEVHKNLVKLFEERGYRIPEMSKKMAMVPEDCKVFINQVGTAAGMWFEIEGVVVVSMPGVPHEMKRMMSRQILPAIHEQFDTPNIYHRQVMTAGIGESRIAEKISDIEDSLPPHVKLAYLPDMGTVKLRLSAHGEDEATLKQDVDELADQIAKRIPQYVYGFDGISLEAAIGDLMRSRKYSLGLAESCTGGKIAKRIVSVPGASEYFQGGIVAYSYEMKEKVLGVKKETLDTYGAVSEECISEMLDGALKALDVDCAIAVSGIAGPGGGTPDKPVGTVYVGVATAEDQYIRRYSFPGNREINTELSSVMGMQMLKRFMLGQLVKTADKS